MGEKDEIAMHFAQTVIPRNVGTAESCVAHVILVTQHVSLSSPAGTKRLLVWRQVLIAPTLPVKTEGCGAVACTAHAVFLIIPAVSVPTLHP